MFVCVEDLDVPAENLAAGSGAARSFPSEARVGIASMPDLPVEVLETALNAVMCGSPESPHWAMDHAREGAGFTSAQWSDLALWARDLLPAFGLPSEAHAGLFRKPGAEALITRLGAFHVTAWAYQRAAWHADGGTNVCLVAMRRTFLRAEMRVSEIYRVEEEGRSDCPSPTLARLDLVDQLLNVTTSLRRNLDLAEHVGGLQTPLVP